MLAKWADTQHRVVKFGGCAAKLFRDALVYQDGGKALKVINMLLTA